MTDEEPLAFNIVKIKEAMLAGIIVPRGIVNKAFQRLDEQLDAKTTKHFSFKGKVIDSRDVADNGARLQAIDQVFSASGIFRPDDRRSAGPSVPHFSVEITKDGVIRIATGSASIGQLPESEPGSAIPIEQPVAIPLSVEKAGRCTALVQEKVNRFNTILDEIADE